MATKRKNMTAKPGGYAVELHTHVYVGMSHNYEYERGFYLQVAKISGVKSVPLRSFCNWRSAFYM